MSKEFDELPLEHSWAQNRGSKHNGLYFIPTEEDRNDALVDHTIFSDTDITANFFNDPLFKILDLGFGFIYFKLDIRRHCTISLSNPDFDISSIHGRAVEQHCKFFSSLLSLSSFTTFCSVFIFITSYFHYRFSCRGIPWLRSPNPCGLISSMSQTDSLCPFLWAIPTMPVEIVGMPFSQLLTTTFDLWWTPSMQNFFNVSHLIIISHYSSLSLSVSILIEILSIFIIW